MSHYFVDASGSISNVRRTAVGGLLLDATLAKVGVMEYVYRPTTKDERSQGFKVIRRYNPASVLEAAVADIATAPVTREHPKKFLDTSNYQQHAKGHVVGTPIFKDGHIYATLAINDEQLIKDIESGKRREVSMGYYADHDGQPGQTDSGESYDEARVKIEWNHIAVVECGRAGRSVRLMLDSAEIPEEPSYTDELERLQQRVAFLEEQRRQLAAERYPTISLEGRSPAFVDALLALPR